MMPYFEDFTVEGERVVSFTPEHELKIYYDQLLTLAFTETTHPLHANYGSNYDAAGHILLSVVLKHNEPIMISSLYIRDFYGPSVARCLSRTWKIKGLRNSKGSFEFSERIGLMLKHQVHFAREFAPLNFLFISNQKFHPRVMKIFADGATSVSNIPWQAGESPCLVAPDEKNASCWQWICYTKFFREEGKFPFKIR